LQIWQSSKLMLAMLARHPRRVGASLAVVLLGTGVTAFGLVPLAPDAADLPVTQVVETVQALPWQAGKESLSDQGFNLYRTEVSRSSDTAESLLRRLGIDDPSAAAFLRSDTLARSLLVGRAGNGIMGDIKAKALESSTVDMTNELVRLMVLQRSYSASSQTMRAYDQTLRDVIQMVS
jgi:hypothetical protein